MLVFIFCFTFLVFWWCYQGYFFFLMLLKDNEMTLELCPKEKTVSVIVPVYNEEKLIKDKLLNSLSIVKGNVQVYFADASTDNTSLILKDFVQNNPCLSVVRCELAGRSSQINEALKQISSDLVLMTDVDALLPENIIDRVVELFTEDVGIVGVNVEPIEGYRLDSVFWRSQNSMRHLENMVKHCPVASGACYAFRRNLIEFLPEDVWADDIYIPFIANTRGYKSIIAEDIFVKEVRGPENFKDFFLTKIRKCQDNLKELCRAIPSFKDMSGVWSVIFITRFLQIAGVGLLFVPFVLMFVFQPIGVIVLISIFVLFCAFIQKKLMLNRESVSEKNVSVIDTLCVVAVTTASVVCAVFDFIIRKGRTKYVRVVE